MSNEYYTPPPDTFAPPPREPKKPLVSKRFVVTLVAIGAFAVLLVIASTAVFVYRTQEAEQAKVDVEQAQRLAGIPSGAGVLDVPSSSEAAQLGIHPGDIIVGYDGSRVTDIPSYWDAMKRAADAGKSSVTITIARGTETVKVTAAPHLIGMTLKPWTLLKDRISAMLRGPDRERALALIADAQRDGTLSAKHLLIVKLQAIDDYAGPEQAAQRDELIGLLLGRCEPDELFRIAFDEFDNHGTLRSAAALYGRLLEVEPDNINARLNRANALANLAEFDEAERLVMIEYGKKSKPNLAPHGYFVSERILGIVRTGQGRYAESAAFFRSAMERERRPDAWGIQLSYMNAAGRAGGVEGFDNARKYCQSVSGERFSKWQCHVDAIEAYVLAENGRHDDAARLVEHWRNDDHARHNVEEYYAQPYLKTSDVVASWKALLDTSSQQ
jgi:hypothetical protein